ncbi:hypothetical protein BJY04DRAFT_202600 [Aspergillus karnatakaensis]|uniref:uncharacterized protein n=1 Tax=Aspergillus karnatakaensis TaxID=1810916 RepID=UPI003CCDCE9A
MSRGLCLFQMVLTLCHESGPREICIPRRMVPDVGASLGCWDSGQGMVRHSCSGIWEMCNSALLRLVYGPGPGRRGV